MTTRDQDRDIAKAINELREFLKDAGLAGSERRGADWYWGLRLVPTTTTSTALPPEVKAKLKELQSEDT